MGCTTFALLGLLILNQVTNLKTGYFPPELFHENPQWDAATSETIGEYLAAAEEVPLREATSGAETYRLTWLPNFDPGVVVRITDSGRSEARVVRYSGLSPEEGVTVTTVRLNCEEWQALKAQIEDSQFWGAMKNRPLPKDQIMIDGSFWVLEGVRDRNYKAVHRAFPRREREEDAEFLEVGLAILRMAGVDIDLDDVY